MAKRSLSCRPTKREEEEFNKHLDRFITLLWITSCLRAMRAWAPIRSIREGLADIRRSSESEYRHFYRASVLHTANLGGVAPWPDGELPEVREQKQLSAGPRWFYDRVVEKVLDSAGLFNAAFPFEHSARRVLVAHLLFAEDEITKAEILPEPHPWTVALQREEGHPLRVWADMDIRPQEQRLRNRLERVLFALQQPPLIALAVGEPENRELACRGGPRLCDASGRRVLGRDRRRREDQGVAGPTEGPAGTTVLCLARSGVSPAARAHRRS